MSTTQASESCENLKKYDKFVLDMYKQTMESFQQLTDMLHQSESASDVTITHIVHVCKQKLQNLIDIEAECFVNNPSDMQFHQVLLFLQSQFAQIEPPKPRNVVPLTKKNKPPETVVNTQVTPRAKGFQDVAGLANVKEELTAIVILPTRQPQLFTNHKLSNSLLLYGPPGTGKTWLVHALAAEASARLYSISSSDILSKYVGENEKMLKSIFTTVKEGDGSTILFMDEIDGLCTKRSDTENEWNRRLKTELMCQISDFEGQSNVFLICATNCPWDLDPAILRRFQRRLYVPLPTRPDRFDLLQLLTRDTPLEQTCHLWGDLLTRTEGYSGSDLSDLIRYALNIPIVELIRNQWWEKVGDVYRPVSSSADFNNVEQRDLVNLPQNSVQARSVHMNDMMTALNVIKPTVSDALMQRYRTFVSEAN